MSKIKHWSEDEYWTDALEEYLDARNEGKSKIEIDLDKLHDVILPKNGPEFKLMEAMVSVYEQEGLDGCRGATRVLLAMLWQLEQLTQDRQENPDDDYISDVIFSTCKKYRYALTKTWDESLPKLMYIGLNPSVADSKKDDPTVKKCVAYAKELGFGSILIGNLFSYISPNPENLKKADDPIGPENDKWLLRLADESDKVIAMWGNHGSYRNRCNEVCELDIELNCLEVTKKDQPYHILYLPYGLKPKRYKP